MKFSEDEKENEKQAILVENSVENQAEND